MWLKRGHSLGKNAQAISNAFTCQYSYSNSFSFLISAFINPDRDWIINLISVETQKYETIRSWSFSKKDSRDNYYSFLVNYRKSLILTG